MERQKLPDHPHLSWSRSDHMWRAESWCICDALTPGATSCDQSPSQVHMPPSVDPLVVDRAVINAISTELPNGKVIKATSSTSAHLGVLQTVPWTFRHARA
jgi:hypothetical protein